MDLRKFISDAMVPAMRSNTAIEYIHAHLLELQRALYIFNRKKGDLMYRAAATGSVISLEHAIEREFDVQCTISELDGKPTDFLVSIDGYADEVRLRAFINQQKLFGKSYIFRQGDVKFTAQFIGHICEQTPYDYTAKWIEHKCEDMREVYLEADAEMVWGGINPEWDIVIRASKPVASRLTIAGSTLFESEHATEMEKRWICTIQVGDTMGRSRIGTINETAEIASWISDCTPASDVKYDYIFTKKPD